MSKIIKKYVLTGAASCGKTELIDELRRRGFNVLEEAAREVIEDRLDIPVSNDEILKRQLLIFKRQLRRENYDFHGDFLFLDRGLADCITYCEQLLGFVPEEIACGNHRNRYEGVFILEKLPLVKAEYRVEKSDAELDRIHSAIIKTYQDLGYSPVFVPVMSVRNRANFIFDCVWGENGIRL